MLRILGTLILGVGDSLASLFGSTLGTIKWHQDTNKSIQGSVAALGGMLAILGHFGSEFFLPRWLIFKAQLNLCTILATTLVLVFEGVTLQIDNLVLSMLYTILLASC